MSAERSVLDNIFQHFLLSKQKSRFKKNTLSNIFRKGVFLKVGLLLKRSDFIAYLKSLLSAFGKF